MGAFLSRARTAPKTETQADYIDPLVAFDLAFVAIAAGVIVYSDLLQTTRDRLLGSLLTMSGLGYLIWGLVLILYDLFWLPNQPLQYASHCFRRGMKYLLVVLTLYSVALFVFLVVEMFSHLDNASFVVRDSYV